jgi:hypothetical protein
MWKPATVLVIALAVGAGVSSCHGGPELPPYRCLGELSLGDLIKNVGLPQPQSGGWLVSGGEVGMDQRVFDSIRRRL